MASRAWVDRDGFVHVDEEFDIRGEGMYQPVRCTHCGKVYDLGKVEVTARFTDCSVWNAPCCGRQVDDRGETGWTSRADYRRLPRER